MKHVWKAVFLAWVFGAIGLAANAQTVPTSKDQVAHPGGKLPGDPKLAVIKVVDGFHDPVGVASAHDGTKRIFVVERVGRVWIVENGKKLPKPFLDLTVLSGGLSSEIQTGFVEQGLWTIAFHPEFKKNGYVFASWASLPFNGAHMITRFTVDPKRPNEITTERANQTAKVIAIIPQPWYNHYGGGIAFGPDGYLYVGKGDGGWEGDPLEAGQDKHTLLGKMLRIDVNTPDNVPYSIPSTNPYAAAVKPTLMGLFGVTEEGFSHIKREVRPEIWAYGLRNPYSFHFDSKTGNLFVAEVGQNHWEEVDFQPASSKGGENYGWALNMGTHCHPMLGANDQCPQVGTLPVAEYPHTGGAYPGGPPVAAKDGGGCAVIGLGVAHYAGLNGAYVVGDWCVGTVWGIGWADGRWHMQELAATGLMITAGTVDEDGGIVATNCNCFYTDDKGAMANPTGSLWRLVAANAVPAGAEMAPPRK